MAHNIRQMVYAGENPWHKLGTQLPANGTWEEIREAAGFYTALRQQMKLDNGKVNPDVVALVRHDTQEYLATVSRGYSVLQFEDLAHAGVLAAAGARAIWHTAGTLGETGARGWMLAELPEPIRVRHDTSEIRKYVLLTTAHDGTAAAVLANVATRVVCQNTLGAALRERSGSRWSIRHSRNAKRRLDDAAKAFSLMTQEMHAFEELANVLVGQRYTEAQHREAVEALLPYPKEDIEKRHPRIDADRKAALQLFSSFRGASAGIRGTAYGAFQAWTEFSDHRKDSVTGALVSLDDRKASRRLLSSTIGDGAVRKSKALDFLLKQTGTYARDGLALAL
jgi:phage/plasmid-like protein (TIGR03299 family)